MARTFCSVDPDFRRGAGGRYVQQAWRGCQGGRCRIGLALGVPDNLLGSRDSLRGAHFCSVDPDFRRGAGGRYVQQAWRGCQGGSCRIGLALGVPDNLLGSRDRVGQPTWRALFAPLTPIFAGELGADMYSRPGVVARVAGVSDRPCAGRSRQSVRIPGQPTWRALSAPVDPHFRRGAGGRYVQQA